VQGRLSNVAMYDTALPQSRIAAHYDAGWAVEYTSTVKVWNGTEAETVTLLGVWDGANVDPVDVLGVWDGSSIKALG
jgi:hypothetical protein